MISLRSNSLKNLIFNYSTVAYNIVAGIFLVPFYLSKIPLEIYGSFLTASSITGLIGLMEFGLSMVLTQRLSRSYAKTEWQTFRGTLYSGLLAASLLFILTCLVTALASSSIGAFTRISYTYQTDLRNAFILLGISAACSIYQNMFGAIFQALLKAGTLGLINLLSAIIGILTVIFAFHWYGNLAAIATGTLARVLCANILLAVKAWISLRKNNLLPQSTPLTEIKQIINTCIPLFLGSISKSIAENAQNLLLTHFVSPASVAIFTLTQKAMQVCSMILAPIGSSIYSALSHVREIKGMNYLASLMAISIRTHFLLSVILIGTAMVFNQQFVTLWVGSDKFGGLLLSYMLGVSTLLVTRFTFIGFLIYSTGEFKKPLMLEIGYSCLKIILLLLLLPENGILAVPIADLIAGFVFFYILGNRLIKKFINNSIFDNGISFVGWIELAAIAILGHILITTFMIKTNWATLLCGAILFAFITIIITIFLHAYFTKNVI